MLEELILNCQAVLVSDRCCTGHDAKGRGTGCTVWLPFAILRTGNVGYTGEASNGM